LAPEPIEAILTKEVGALLSKELIEEISIAPEALSQWAECFRIVQASEIWEEHGHWAEQHLHEFGPGIKERFEIAKSLDPNVIATAKLEKIRIEKYLKHLLSNLSGETAEAILVTPSTGCIAPLLTSSSLELEQVRKQLFQLLCIAGLGGLPQVNIPICQYENAPLGVSLIANSQQDLFLLHTIQRLSIQQFS
jgi:amidase